MSILQVLKLGAKAYNRAGYKLGQIVELSVPKYASDIGVTSIKKATIQHISGEEKIVERWLDKNGKAIKTIHTSTANPNEKVVTDYEIYEPIIYNKNLTNMKICDPFAFENIIVKIKRAVMEKVKDESLFFNKKITHTILDINKEHKTLTKGIATVDDKFITSEIYSIQNGKKIKGITKKTQEQQDGTCKTVSTNYFGITSKDIDLPSYYGNIDIDKILTNDEYFYLRFFPESEILKKCLSNAAKRQQVDRIPTLVLDESFFRVPNNSFLRKDKTISYPKNLEDYDKSSIIGSIEHEMKHIKQHELIEKYIKCELTNPEEIELAKKYKDNFENYINPFGNPLKYHEQIVEDEAYTIGNKIKSIYDWTTRILHNIFKFSSNTGIGG